MLDRGTEPCGAAGVSELRACQAQLYDVSKDGQARWSFYRSRVEYGPTYAIVYPDCDINFADINGDGTVGAFDIEPFLGILFP